MKGIRGGNAQISVLNRQGHSVWGALERVNNETGTGYPRQGGGCDLQTAMEASNGHLAVR